VIDLFRRIDSRNVDRHCATTHGISSSGLSREIIRLLWTHFGHGPDTHQGDYTNNALRSVVTYRPLRLALHIRSLPASCTALPLPRTHDQEIFAAGATSLQVGFVDGFLGFFLKCVTPPQQMRHSAYSLVRTTVINSIVVLLLILIMRTFADAWLMPTRRQFSDVTVSFTGEPPQQERELGF